MKLKSFLSILLVLLLTAGAALAAPESFHWEPIQVLGYNNGLFYCANDNEHWYIMDENSEIIAQLPEGVALEKFVLPQGAEDRLLETSDGCIRDGRGEVIFDPAAEGYLGVFFSGCMDCGYLIVYKDVNTFAKTGREYYSYNIETGESIMLDNVDSDAADKFWHYFGNGHFLYAAPNMGFGNEHTSYNIVTNETKGCTIRVPDGRVIDQLPDIAFWDTYPQDDTYFYGVDNPENGDGTLCRIVYNFTDGTAEAKWTEMPAAQFLREMGVTNLDNVYSFELNYEDEGDVVYLLDMVTNVYTKMSLYADFALHAQKGDAYACTVTNEGGGRFFTVVNADGSPRFEPIVLEYAIQFANENYIVADQNDRLEVYDWDGNLLTEIPITRAAFADEAILFAPPDTSTIGLFNVTTGETMDVKAMLEEGESFSGYSEVYNGLFFMGGDKILMPDGQVHRFHLKVIDHATGVDAIALPEGPTGVPAETAPDAEDFGDRSFMTYDFAKKLLEMPGTLEKYQAQFVEFPQIGMKMMVPADMQARPIDEAMAARNVVGSYETNGIVINIYAYNAFESVTGKNQLHLVDYLDADPAEEGIEEYVFKEPAMLNGKPVVRMNIGVLEERIFGIMPEGAGQFCIQIQKPEYVADLWDLYTLLELSAMPIDADFDPSQTEG